MKLISPRDGPLLGRHVASRFPQTGLLTAPVRTPSLGSSLSPCTCVLGVLGDHLKTTWRAQSAVLHASVMPFFIHILHNHFYSYVVSNIFIHNLYRTIPEFHSSIVPESFIKYLQDLFSANKFKPQ